MCSLDHLGHHVSILTFEDQVYRGVSLDREDTLQDFVVQHVDLSDEHIVHMVRSQVSRKVTQDFKDII
jgi:hypothetical protein